MFVKIKNWASCIPEEVRKKDDFMPIYGFERVVSPKKVKSPFVGEGAVKGPGGIGEPVEKVEGEKTEGAGTRKRTRRGAAAETGKGVAAQVSKTYVPVAPAVATSAGASAGGIGDTKDRSMLTAAGNLSVPPIVDKLPAETS